VVCLAIAVIGSAPAGSPPGAAAVRRAAISDTQLAAVTSGVLYLEVVAAPGDTAAKVAAIYAGSEKAAPAIRAANDGSEPTAETFYRIPFELLLNVHRRAVLSALYPEELPRSPLVHGSDGEGPYGLYRLRSGEALYSSVVVRFCGRVDPAEVNALAEVIAARSGIKDVRRIPADYPVKIPLNLILPEFLPEGAPERVEVEDRIASMIRYRLSSGAARLQGVHVILDAGHGGDDPGAESHGVSEDEYAYDVMCRVRDLLIRRTAARVATTIRDRSTGYQPIEGRLRRGTDEYLLTEPPYDLRSPGAATTGVNLRWQFANKELDRLTAQGVDPEKVIFISFHADSLHRSLRGTMIYVPGREHRRALPRGVSAADLDRAEGLSRSLARELILSLRAREVAVHPFIPIRDHVIRSGRRWIPAVLRASRVPHSLLIEIVNLNNDLDRERIVEGKFRQNVAAAVVEALTRHYAEDCPAPPVLASRAGGGASLDIGSGTMK